MFADFDDCDDCVFQYSPEIPHCSCLPETRLTGIITTNISYVDHNACSVHQRKCLVHLYCVLYEVIITFKCNAMYTQTIQVKHMHKNIKKRSCALLFYREVMCRCSGAVSGTTEPLMRCLYNVIWVVYLTACFMPG